MAKKAVVEKVKHPKALAAYLDRIGAETLSFRRAMVKERSKGDNYYIERTLIKIAADGTIDCSRKEHAPTKEEAEHIVAQFKSLEFPKSIGATVSGYKAWLDKASGDKSRFFPLYSRANGLKVTMVQERIERTDGGGKIFIPHSYWDDGEWRAMEPDGLLPFWKPEKRIRARIMVHEGCKAAKFVHELTLDEDRLAKHPWGETLSLYEHWGMIGGALAPHRTDYDELKKEKATEVIYVCDNDYAGDSALQEVSKAYGFPLKGIKFDKRFKSSWDMADAMPDNLFTSKGRYIGPTLAGLIVPATRATELVPPEGGKGRPVAVLKRFFKEEWVHAVTPEVFIHKEWPNKILSLPEFNNHVAPFSDVDDTARLLKKDAASKSAVLKYDPGKEPGIYGALDSGRFINTHLPTEIKAEKGDPNPWLDFMTHLIPDKEDRENLMRWCATLIARPATKMMYGVLLISEVQGIGKSTLGEKILAPLAGESNVSYPSENEIVESNFNYWLAHKRLAVVHEIYAGHSAKAYNRLKSIITDRYITVSKKFQANYEIENWMHVFACSNSTRAIQLSADDRRWFVPKVTEDKLSPEYWARFNEWLAEGGGLGIIKWWATEWLKKNNAVMAGEDAPGSKMKTEVIEEGYSPGMALVASVFRRLEEELGKPEAERWTGKGALVTRSSKVDENTVVIDTDLVDLIRNVLHEGRHSERLEKPNTVRKVAKASGWFVVEDNVTTTPRWGIKATKTRVLVRSKKDVSTPVNVLIEGGKMPINLREFMEL